MRGLFERGKIIRIVATPPAIEGPASVFAICLSHHLRQVFKDHEMGWFGY